MDQPVVVLSVLFLVLLAAGILLAMWFGWRNRKQRSQLLIPALPEQPTSAELGSARTALFEVTYVCSTRSGDWLDRVNAHDLGVRSAATVQVFDAGVVIERVGARSIFIPAAQVRAASLTPGMAGKVVGRDGIVIVTWTPTNTDTVAAAPILDTGLFPAHRAERDVLRDAISRLISPHPAGNGATNTPNPERNVEGSQEPEENK